MPAKRSFFLTATNTDAGKTYIGQLFLKGADQAGLKCAAVKPVTAGAVTGSLPSEDASLLQMASNTPLDPSMAAPLVLETPCAPSIAAKLQGRQLQASRVVGLVRGALSMAPECVLVEGAGGWLCPVNSKETLANVVLQLNLPVVLVVGVELGCMNHALLSMESMQRSGARVLGWVANEPKPAQWFEEQVAELAAMLPAPLLGVRRYQDAEPLDWPL